MMSSRMLAALNLGFFVFHTALVLFNVFGWIHPMTRRWNLVTLLLTLAGWTVLGIWYGVGYCVCTDWHWEVRRAMGIEETASSYIVLLVRSLSGWDPPVALAHNVALVVFVVALTMSVTLNVRDHRRRAKV
jgi:hypothetical protein